MAPARAPGRAAAASARSKAFSVFVLYPVGVGIAFGLTVYASVVGDFRIEVASTVAMIGLGIRAYRAVRPVHVAPDMFEHWIGR